MPKMKTNKSMAKRFKKTASGKLKRHSAFMNHMFESKSPKRKRNLRKASILVKGDQKRYEQALAYLKR
jgi:large subunit ribosomal protein L35